MSNLVIVESPNKIKSIQKYLGDGYSVMASKGHVRDLPKSSLGIDIEHGFTPNYKNMPDKKEVIKSLKAAAEKADFVYLATDPDREGEAISWHLAQILGLPTDQNNRVCFNEITKTGITNGMATPRKLDLSLVDAQQARRVLDRIVGYKLSPFLWKKVKSGLSAGRVQSVALRMMVDREREIEAFVPQEYWTIDAKLKKGKSAFTAKFYGKDGEKVEIQNGEQAKAIENDLQNAEFKVQNVKKSDKNRQPAPPFTTSTMQQEAARKLGFTGQRTMRVAQTLYEGVNVKGHGFTGLITYKRTDSLRISEEARAQANDVISDKFGKNYLPEKPRYYKSKASAQDAHEAIRPAVPSLVPSDIKDSLTADQYKLYKLIWDRFIASLMANEVLSVVSVDISAGDYNFKAGRSDVKFDGFAVLYTEGKDEEDEKSEKLPPLAVGDMLELQNLESDKHFTQPPSRYSEATLIKALDENGIGRPSTYAPILSNIISKDYIEREKKMLVPTALGMIVTDLLKDNFDKIVDTKFTAGMEDSLDKIEEGNLGFTEVIEEFYGDFEKTLKGAEEKMEGKKVQVPVEETDEVCELCGKKMVIRSGGFGKFLACAGYPECKNTKPLPENEIKQPCPKCGGKLVSRISKKGKKFYGCSNYPKCDFAAPSLPTGEVCKECGSFILKGARGKNYCQNADCPTRKAAEKADK
ncbi:MAG: type I DNA topoisomerase [Oscillospiraceae bacterium]|nr:type I DNA topoisomerase [Candidatus Equicaccousia limihippi]